MFALVRAPAPSDEKQREDDGNRERADSDDDDDACVDDDRQGRVCGENNDVLKLLTFIRTRSTHKQILHTYRHISVSVSLVTRTT